jgi:hypothetical protein
LRVLENFVDFRQKRVLLRLRRIVRVVLPGTV